jgi:hypothetical protein
LSDPTQKESKEMRSFVLIGLTLAALVAPCGVSAKVVSAFGIKVQRCVVNENGSHTQTNGVNVVYYNSHETPATEVDFFVRYHGTTYTLTDRGTFTHYARIDHNLGDALVGQVWQGEKPELCTPARVLFATGRVLM